MPEQQSPIPCGIACTEIPVDGYATCEDTQFLRDMLKKDRLKNDSSWAFDIRVPLRKTKIYGFASQQYLRSIFKDSMRNLQVYVYHRLINADKSAEEITLEYGGFKVFIETDAGRQKRKAAQAAEEEIEQYDPTEDLPF